MAKRKYTVQIRVPVVVSREVPADSLTDAIEQARKYQWSDMVRPMRGWGVEWDEETEVVGVIG